MNGISSTIGQGSSVEHNNEWVRSPVVALPYLESIKS